MSFSVRSCPECGEYLDKKEFRFDCKTKKRGKVCLACELKKKLDAVLARRLREREERMEFCREQRRRLFPDDE